MLKQRIRETYSRLLTTYNTYFGGDVFRDIGLVLIGGVIALLVVAVVNNIVAVEEKKQDYLLPAEYMFSCMSVGVSQIRCTNKEILCYGSEYGMELVCKFTGGSYE